MYLTPQRGSTSGAQRLSRRILPRPRRLCTQLCLWSSHLVGNHYFDFGDTAVAAACSPCHDHVFPSCPDFGSPPRAQATREQRWRHIEHLLFECQCIPGLDSSVAITLLRYDLFWVCSKSDHAEALLRAAFPFIRVPVVAAMDCILPFLLNPAAALGRVSPWHMQLHCLDLVDVEAFRLGVSSAVSTRQPLTVSMLACLLGHPSIRGCSACGPVLILPQRACLRLILLHMSVPVRTGAVADVKAWVWHDVRSICFFSGHAIGGRQGRRRHRCKTHNK